MVFVGGIQIHVVAFVCEVFALKGEPAGPVVIINRRLFPGRAPLRFHRFRNYPKISNWAVAVARGLQGAAANKGEFGMVKDVPAEVSNQDSGCSRSHEPIQGLLEKRGHRRKADLMRKVSSYCPLARGGIVRLTDTRQE